MPKKKSWIKKHLDVVIIIIILVAIVGYVFYVNYMPKEEADTGEKTTTINEVVATVNSEEITQTELTEQYELFFVLNGFSDSYRQIITEESFLNNTLVSMVVLVQEAEEEGITVTDEEVDSYIDETLQLVGLSKAELELSLQEPGLDFSNVEGLFKTQLLINKLFNESLLSSVEVSDSEAKTYFNNNAEQFEDEEFADVETDVKQMLLANKQRTALTTYVSMLRKNSDIEMFPGEKEVIEEAVSCVDKYALPEKTILFYYKESCEFSEYMTVIVDKLEAEGLDFLGVDGDAEINTAVINDCFESGKGVPQFLCTATGDLKTGTLKEASLREFAESCS